MDILREEMHFSEQSKRLDLKENTAKQDGKAQALCLLDSLCLWVFTFQCTVKGCLLSSKCHKQCLVIWTTLLVFDKCDASAQFPLLGFSLLFFFLLGFIFFFFFTFLAIKCQWIQGLLCKHFSFFVGCVFFWNCIQAFGWRMTEKEDRDSLRGRLDSVCVDPLTGNVPRSQARLSITYCTIPEWPHAFFKFTLHEVAIKRLT